MSRVETDILIVGAGFAGAATAYHLALVGREDVLVVEQEEVPGVHSSGRNAAIIREHADDPSEQEVISEGAGELRLGRLALYNRCGVMLVGFGEDDVGSRFPGAIGKGQWCADDGTVDTAHLLRTYLDGRDVRYNTKVLKWESDGDKLRVHTNQGEILCNLLVNAAGPWAGELGDLPMVPMNRHLFVTPPLDRVEADLPVVWNGTCGLYFRPESGGLLLCCCDETPASPGDYREDHDVFERLAERLSSLQPELGELSIQSMWVGQRVFAPDRKFVIGFDPRCERLFHVAGLGGHGVTASYSVGRLAAELIDQGPGNETSPWTPSRLSLTQSRNESLRADLQPK